MSAVAVGLIVGFVCCGLLIRVLGHPGKRPRGGLTGHRCRNGSGAGVRRRAWRAMMDE